MVIGLIRFGDSAQDKSGIYECVKFLDVLRAFLNFPENFGSAVLDADVYRAPLKYKAGPRLQECCRQVEAEVVSNCRNKIHQTWIPH